MLLTAGTGIPKLGTSTLEEESSARRLLAALPFVRSWRVHLNQENDKFILETTTWDLLGTKVVLATFILHLLEQDDQCGI